MKILTAKGQLCLKDFLLEVSCLALPMYSYENFVAASCQHYLLQSIAIGGRAPLLSGLVGLCVGWVLYPLYHGPGRLSSFDRFSLRFLLLLSHRIPAGPLYGLFLNFTRILFGVQDAGVLISRQFLHFPFWFTDIRGGHAPIFRRHVPTTMCQTVTVDALNQSVKAPICKALRVALTRQ